MRKTIYVLIVREESVREESHIFPSYKIAVETWYLLGFIPVWQRQNLISY